MWQHGEGIGLLGWSGWYRRSGEPRGMASEAVSTGTANPSRLLRWDSRHSGPHQWGKLFRADDLVMKGQVYVSRRAGFLSRTSTQSLKWAWGWPVQGVKGNASLSFIVPHFRGWPERIFPSLSCICNTVSTGQMIFQCGRTKSWHLFMKPKDLQFCVRSLWKGEEREGSWSHLPRTLSSPCTTQIHHKPHTTEPKVPPAGAWPPEGLLKDVIPYEI